MNRFQYKLSFIIPAWNEEKLIGNTIESIQRAAMGKSFEIIVSDDASSDNTADIATKLGAVVVTCDNRQIGATRNDGAAVASGEIFVFVDADTLVTKEAIDEMLDVLREGVVAGTSFPLFDGQPPLLATCLTPVVRWLFYFLQLAAGAFMFCTQEAFEKAGGFDLKYFAAEEVHLSISLHKYGRFKTLKSRVITSGRKFRTHSSLQILLTLFLVSIPGVRSIKKRKDLWYGSRKPEA